MAAPYPEVARGVKLPCDRFLLHLCTHLAFHLGQAGYLRRILTGDSRTTGAVSMQQLVDARGASPAGARKLRVASGSRERGSE